MGLYGQKKTFKDGIVDKVKKMLYICSCLQHEKNFVLGCRIN